MTTADHHVRISFQGARAGSGPVTWSQRENWKNILVLGDGAHYYNLRGMRPVPAGTTMDAVVEVVSRTFARHEMLRTTFTFDDDVLIQHIADRGEVEVAVYEAGERDVEEFAGSVLMKITATMFDYPREWPVIWSIVTVDGAPTHLCFCLSHVAIDAWSIDVLASELDLLLAGQQPTGPADWHPLDQAAFERTEEGAHRNARAVGYWRDTLTDAPRTMFDYPAFPPAPRRFVQYALTSGALEAAVSMLARRCRVTTSTVLLAAPAAVLGRYTGNELVVMQLITANRIEPRIRRMVGPTTQNGLFTMDLSDATFATLVRRTLTRSMQCLRFSAYDFLDVEAVKADLARRRGHALDLLAFFNDTRAEPHRRPSDADPDPDVLVRLLDKTEVELADSWDNQDMRFFVAVSHAPDALRVTLIADTACIPQAQVPDILRGIESLVVTAALDDAPLAELAQRIGLPVVAAREFGEHG